MRGDAFGVNKGLYIVQVTIYEAIKLGKIVSIIRSTINSVLNMDFIIINAISHSTKKLYTTIF